MSIISWLCCPKGLALASLVSGGWPGCHNGLLLWPCGHSELNEVAAAGKRRGGLAK